MTKIKQHKNPYCGCPVHEIEHPSRKTFYVITHEENCSWIKDVGAFRLSVLDENGKLIESISW